jgi:hypothetical protein
MKIARLNSVTTSLVSSHKLCEILREIVLRMPQGYSLLAPVRPESMHIFYATSTVTVIATKETIRLVIQIPLKTDRSSYSVYEPIRSNTR